MVGGVKGTRRLGFSLADLRTVAALSAFCANLHKLVIINVFVKRHVSCLRMVCETESDCQPTVSQRSATPVVREISRNCALREKDLRLSQFKRAEWSPLILSCAALVPTNIYYLRR